MLFPLNATLLFWMLPICFLFGIIALNNGMRP